MLQKFPNEAFNIYGQQTVSLHSNQNIAYSTWGRLGSACKQETKDFTWIIEFAIKVITKEIAISYSVIHHSIRCWQNKWPLDCHISQREYIDIFLWRSKSWDWLDVLEAILTQNFHNKMCSCQYRTHIVTKDGIPTVLTTQLDFYIENTTRITFNVFKRAPGLSYAGIICEEPKRTPQ